MNPLVVSPAQPKRRVRAFDDPAWIFEPKYNGERGILYLAGGRANFRSKSGKIKPGRYQKLADDIARELRVKSAIIDGEIVVLNPITRYSSVTMLRRSAGPLVFIAFDLLVLDGEKFTGRKLEERKRQLDKLLSHKSRLIQPTQYWHECGKRLMAVAFLSGWEGIVAKPVNSFYHGSAGWQKIRTSGYKHTKKPKRR